MTSESDLNGTYLVNSFRNFRSSYEYTWFKTSVFLL